MSWIQTYTNLEFRYDEIDPDRISLEDIARSLSQQSRFLGHLNRKYSLAEHCVHVANRAEILAISRRLPSSDIIPCARWGLLHDASEAYVGDLPAPLKRMPFMAGYVSLEKNIQAAIKEKFGIATTPEMEVIVKQADLELLNTERQQLMGAAPAAWVSLPPPLDLQLECWTPVYAEANFLQYWKGLV